MFTPGVDPREVLRSAGWWVGEGREPLVLCAKHVPNPHGFSEIGIYPHCEHCAAERLGCVTKRKRLLHNVPCLHDIACRGARPA